MIPYELSLIPANDLVWRPNPVLQTYSAYTGLLDLITAEHFQGPRASRFVILHMATIDVRHPLADAPATARSLLRRYRPVGVDDSSRRVPLRLDPKRAPRRPEAASLPIECRAVLGEWVEVPASPVPLAAELGFRLSVRERLQRLAFRIPAMSMEIQYEDGAIVPLRILPDTAAAGVPLSHLPRNAAACAALFEGHPMERARRFRVGGLGALLYEPEFTLRWVPAASGG